MMQVSATQLRRNLSDYLARVERGETIRIRLHGRLVGSIEPAHGDPHAALAKLRELGRSARIGDLLTPVGQGRWLADENHL